MPDLETRLREYAVRLDQRHPDVGIDELVDPDSPLLVGLQSDPGLGRGRGRRNGIAVAAGLALFMAFLLLLGVPRIVDVHPAEPMTAGPSLGVFEPIRGWIVYQNLGHLEAIDPQDPSTTTVIETPDAAGAIPSAWSADGSVLALEQEGAGGLFVMDQDGAMTNVAPSGGCCGFTTNSWLSPDGSQMTIPQPDGSIAVMDLDGSDPRQLTRAPDGLTYRRASWSPTGFQIAVVVGPSDGGEGNSIALVDVETGETRPLYGSDLPWIRQITWSPDGTQILAVAGDHTPGGLINGVNPAALPIQADLYLIDARNGMVRRIAEGHYVAATWSPDGSQVAGIDYSRPQRDVVVMDVDGSDVRTLTTLPPQEPFAGIAWHPKP